jgi:hypothetical protein
MCARFTPRGLFAGRIAAKVFFVGVTVAILTSIVRSSNRPSPPSSGYYAEPTVTARSTASPTVPVLRPFAGSPSVASVASPVSSPDRPVPSPWPMASPSPDRVVVPIVVQRDPPTVKYEPPQRWEYMQWDFTPIYRLGDDEPSGRKPTYHHPEENEGRQRRREDPPQRAQGISKESHGSTSSARPSSARTSSDRTVERRTEPTPTDGGHTTSGRPTHSADSKSSPTPGKPVPGDRPPRKDEKRESRR